MDDNLFQQCSAVQCSANCSFAMQQRKRGEGLQSWYLGHSLSFSILISYCSCCCSYKSINKRKKKRRVILTVEFAECGVKLVEIEVRVAIGVVVGQHVGQRTFLGQLRQMLILATLMRASDKEMMFNWKNSGTRGKLINSFINTLLSSSISRRPLLLRS